jgi:hypothetical protein
MSPDYQPKQTREVEIEQKYSIKEHKYHKLNFFIKEEKQYG